MAVFGIQDKNTKIIETAFDVSVTARNERIEIKGDLPMSVQNAADVLNNLRVLYDSGETINRDVVYRVLESVQVGEMNETLSAMSDIIVITHSNRPIKCKTIGQKNYIKALQKNTVSLCIGPAGTGKTYLAVAQAVADLKDGKIERIIMSRPAIEAGEERLGFLPGDLAQKVDPYLRPLYDALNEILGAEVVQKYQERGVIEIAPLAYMRGRTLNRAMIIIDESQNASLSTLKMALTRLGEGSKMVLTGDVTQIDLPRKDDSGLEKCASILSGIEGIAIVRLNNRDVVRNQLVKDIVKAFEKAEAEKEKKLAQAKQNSAKRKA
ncbi:MAG: PhoH family protein [Oscillospiraceae bacterium]|nr:PhoH family protein [Oscillospiraceae bacterium]MBQ2791756.1 PhoH family protein [Oscillospiraceae bacterium]MBQ3242496.1 PhoH family protein [Oscillospiraceae bacterium]